MTFLRRVAAVVRDLREVGLMKENDVIIQCQIYEDGFFLRISLYLEKKNSRAGDISSIKNALKEEFYEFSVYTLSNIGSDIVCEIHE